MIRLVEFNGVSSDRFLFHLAVVILAVVREMFVNGLNVLHIDVALLVVRCVIGYAEYFAMGYVRLRQVRRAVSYTHLTLPTILLV